MKGTPQIVDLDARFREMDKYGEYAQVLALPHPVTARYVLLWITRVVPNVGGGNRAAVGLFRVIGPS